MLILCFNLVMQASKWGYSLNPVGVADYYYHSMTSSDDVTNTVEWAVQSAVLKIKRIEL